MTSPHCQRVPVSFQRHRPGPVATDGRPIAGRADAHHLLGGRAGNGRPRTTGLGGLPVAELTHRIVTPGPERSVFSQGDRVLPAGGDVYPIMAGNGGLWLRLISAALDEVRDPHSQIVPSARRPA